MASAYLGKSSWGTGLSLQKIKSRSIWSVTARYSRPSSIAFSIKSSKGVSESAENAEWVWESIIKYAP